MRSLRPKFPNHLVFLTFHYRIFIFFVFNKFSKGMLFTAEKELGEYFQWLHFWNQWVLLIKMYCSISYLFDFDLKIHSGQVWAVCICSFCKSFEWMCIHKGRLVITFMQPQEHVKFYGCFFLKMYQNRMVKLKSVRLKKRQLFEMVISQPFLVILLPTTLISFTKLRFWRSFWDA